MKAMVVRQAPDGPTIEPAELDEPRPGPGQVLVQVHSASVNRADLAVVTGAHSTAGAGPGPTVLGLDAAGVVLEAGPGTDLLVGQRVMTMAAGGLAERVVVDGRLPVPLPDGWSFDEGAAAVLALMTAHNALATAGRMQPGESVLVNAASSGVGQMALQVARSLGAGRLLAAVRTRRDDRLLRELGADEVIDTADGTFADQVLAATSGRGVDVVVDHVGGPYLAQHLQSCAVKGRVVGVGRLGGPHGQLDLEQLALKRLELVGVTFRTRDPDEKAALVRDLRRDVDHELGAGRLKPRIDQVLAWTDVLTAHARVRADAHLGKVVLRVRPAPDDV